MRSLWAVLLVLLPASAPSVVAKIGTDLHPCGAAPGLGSVWVVAYDSGRLAARDMWVTSFAGSGVWRWDAG